MKWKGSLVLVIDDENVSSDLKKLLGNDNDDDVKLDLIEGTFNDDKALFVAPSTLTIDGDDSVIYLIITGSDTEVDKLYFLPDEQEKFKKEWED